jgi:hypothetical protein
VISTSCDAGAIVDQDDRKKAIESIAQSLVDIVDLQSPLQPPMVSNSSQEYVDE